MGIIIIKKETMLTYKNYNYTVREIENEDGDIVNIAADTLSALIIGEDGSPIGLEEEAIDNFIFFYVPLKILTTTTDEELQLYVHNELMDKDYLDIISDLKEMIKNIDWQILAIQKNALLYSLFGNTEEGQGLIHLIDALQDAAVAGGELYSNVFPKQPELEQEFPNGTESWKETHFEVTDYLIYTSEKSETMAQLRHEEMGRGGLYELAEELTNEFEKKYHHIVWGEDLDYNDTLEGFLKEKEAKL